MKYAIVSHDAGGAEILSSLIKRKQILKYKLFLDGPAKMIFSKKLKQVETEDSLDSLVFESDLLLTGTSWQSDLEKIAILRAKSKGIRTVSFLDHWVNYKERFIYRDEIVLPDEIWVGDEFAYSIAKKEFPDSNIFIKENPYVMDIKEEIVLMGDCSEKQINTILYICEPVREHAKQQFGDERYWGYTEEDALEFFFDHSHLFHPMEKIILRPHPSERLDKYNAFLQKYPHLNIQVGGKDSLIQEISKCNIIVGCESMAMVVGILANRRVISTIPKSGRKCTLPHPQIEHLQNLILLG